MPSGWTATSTALQRSTGGPQPESIAALRMVEQVSLVDEYLARSTHLELLADVALFQWAPRRRGPQRDDVPADESRTFLQDHQGADIGSTARRGGYVRGQPLQRGAVADGELGVEHRDGAGTAVEPGGIAAGDEGVTGVRQVHPNLESCATRDGTARIGGRGVADRLALRIAGLCRREAAATVVYSHLRFTRLRGEVKVQVRLPTSTAIYVWLDRLCGRIGAIDDHGSAR